MNIVTAAEDIATIIADLKNGTIDRATADSLVNAYGKVGNLVRNQVAYMALKQANPTMERITFLEAGTERPLLES